MLRRAVSDRVSGSFLSPDVRLIRRGVTQSAHEWSCNAESKKKKSEVGHVCKKIQSSGSSKSGQLVQQYVVDESESTHFPFSSLLEWPGSLDGMGLREKRCP